tara:strand:+ start:13247 stop:13954 length:708 start_codon:yes stop_codon:yes gene_type:complete
MDIDDPVLNENLTYGSPKIFERRRRILESARSLIAERGYDGFGIRELCDRAGVAPQTVYKAFESKERIIALAIRHHFQLFSKQQVYHFDKASLEGVIERLITSDRNMTNMREFVSAIVAMHFSSSSDEDLRRATRANITSTLRPWVVALREGGHLRSGVNPVDFTNSIIALLFYISLEWCTGAISDEDFIFKKLEALLIYSAGACRGAGLKQVNMYLNDLMGKRTKFEEIRRTIK